MSLSEDFYDLIFEVSNEYRHKILLLLQKKALRLTHIAKDMGLNNPEIRRHISRLQNVGLIQRDIEGFYHLTPFGELVLGQLGELEFTSRHREYFKSHSLANLPSNFISRISDLSGSMFTADIFGFFYNIETVIKEAEEYVWFNVDQYPVTALSYIVKALEKGVKFRTIEHEESIAGHHLILQAPDETQTMTLVRTTPLIEQRTSSKIDVILYLSEKRCVLAFPDIDRGFDYRGFTATDERARRWCTDLFQHYWNVAEPKVYISPTEYVRPKRIKPSGKEESRSIVVDGHNESRVDAQAVQDAVDYYDEVTLRGTFNFGSSMVQISKSVKIRGDGRENDIPTTTIYKQGWKFPFTEFDSIFMVNGEGADVTIENIHFIDFNHSCIWGIQCNDLHVKNNRITLNTGYGRGQSFGAFGDVVIGILVMPLDYASAEIFRGIVTVEGNYIDLARGGAFGGFLTRGGLEDDPEYRPDLFNHEYYMGFGIAVHHSSKTVTIENNIIRNANARGIAATCNLPTADVRIRNNTISSDIYGSYPFSSPEAGAGILAQSAWGYPSPGFPVYIDRNTIKLDKLNHSGIVVLGPVTDREGAGKLSGGIVRKNRVHLKHGYEGIHVRKCDNFEVSDNTISGEAYYGIRISGRSRSKEFDLRALNNKIQGNDVRDLRIRDPDQYSSNHADGRMFAETPGGAATAHVWLNVNTNGNMIKVSSNEMVIDQGEDNTIQYE